MEQDEQWQARVAIVLVMDVKPAWQIHESRGSAGIFRLQGDVRDVGSPKHEPRADQDEQQHRDDDPDDLHAESRVNTCS